MTTWQDFPELLQALQFDEKPAGGALKIIQNGEVLVDTAVGMALPDMAWRTDTLSVNFSIGKGVMATLIAVLVSRGLLDYDKPISHYWQAFGAKAKADITLRDVLTHRAGLFNISMLVQDTAQMLDWQIMTDKVANMAIDVPKGQQDNNYQSAYSALVFGWILGSLVERVTNMSLQAALDEFLAKPLGVMGELIYGCPSHLLDKVAKPVKYFDGKPIIKRKPTLKPDTPEIKAFLENNPVSPLWQQALGEAEFGTANINKLYFDTANINLVNYKNALMPNGKDGLEYHHPDVMQALIPAANGISTANALATMYAMHANDGVWQDNVLISPNVLAGMRVQRVDGFDAVMPANMKWRSGFHRLFSIQNTPQAYGHMGYNGSVAFCDPASKLSFAFIHNFDTTMLNDVRQFVLSETAIGLAQNYSL